MSPRASLGIAVRRRGVREAETAMVKAKKDVASAGDIRLIPWESSGAQITLQLGPILVQGAGFSYPQPLGHC